MWSENGLPLNKKGWWRMNTDVLFQFCFLNINFQIVATEEGVFLEILETGYKRIKLDLPIPYNRDSEHTASSTYDTWDSLSLDFKVLEQQKERVVIDVAITSRSGYWYYGSLDDSVPQPSTTRKKLIVNYPSIVSSEILSVESGLANVPLSRVDTSEPY